MNRRLLAASRDVAGPLASLGLVAVWWGQIINGWQAGLVVALLIGGIVSSVRHADMVAARVGRVWGAIVLALAVTVIELSIIIPVLLTGGSAGATLGRDTVFAAVILATNGIIGLSVVTATRRSPTSSFNSEGSGAALGAIATIATLSLVLPSFAESEPSPAPLDTFGLVFISVAAVGTYVLFLYILTVRNTEHFEDVETRAIRIPRQDPPRLVYSLTLLFVSLAAVIALAQSLSLTLEAAVTRAGLPISSVAVILAALILLPEGTAAVRYARAGNLQTSFNLGYGSALASIGLTIPTLAIVAAVFGVDVVFGLEPREIVIFFLTLLVSAITVASHRVTLFQGGLHLVILSAYLLLAIRG